MASKALACFALLQGITFASTCDMDVDCVGVKLCEEGACIAAPDCDLSAIEINTTLNQVRGGRCRTTLEQIRIADPDAVSKEGDVFTLNKRLWIRDGSVLEIHGGAAAASPNETVSQLRMKSGEDFAAKIIAWHGKISINSTSITSWDATVDGPDARAVESGRAFIAALSSEASSGTVFESRMDVQGSEISYLGNAGDYHNDTDHDYGLVWKVKGYDDRYPEDGDLGLFERIGVYGILEGNDIHHNYMGAYCYGMKGDMVWSNNEIYNNTLNGINPQDNSDGMKIHGNHVHDNGWHGIEYSKRCLGAEVYNNRVEDNARAGIFFHRSTDGAIAYNNTCKGNLEGDFGIVESFDVKVYDNVMVGGKYGIRLSLGAENCEVYGNRMLNSSRYGVFFYMGSDEPEASVDGRPRNNTIRNNFISNPAEGKGVAVKESDDNFILDNTFELIDTLRFDDSFNTLVAGNILPDGVSFDLENDATLAEGSQEPTDDDE